MFTRLLFLRFTRKCLFPVETKEVVIYRKQATHKAETDKEISTSTNSPDLAQQMKTHNWEDVC